MKHVRLLAFSLSFIAVTITVKFIIYPPTPWGIVLILATCISLIIMCIPRPDSLAAIDNEEAGNGQHGTARWANKNELKDYFEVVTDANAKKPGIVVGREDNKWIVDVSDVSATLCAPPGGGKTTCLYIPTLIYNAIVNFNTNGSGCSFISTDLKGEEMLKTRQFMQDKGYRASCLDFAQPTSSPRYNILYNINKYIDIYKNTENENEKLIAYAKAERYAKVLAESIVDNMDGSQKSDASQYFNETAKGLVTGLALLVSEYGNEGERHIISVFKLIIELNGLTDESTQENQRSKLSVLLDHISNERLINYVGPAMSADVRSMMNVFSSALSKLVSFIDAELEQMICDHSPDFDDVDFIKSPTIIYIICPDENTTRHFFASLFIRNMMNDLIEQARNTPTGSLNREVICLWDEFGNMPAIKNMDTLLTAARSRKIRFLLALQSIAQLEKAYPQKLAEIVMDAAQMIIFTYVSPMARSTAKAFSEMLGTQTIKSGSVAQGDGISDNKVTYQMISRPLMYPDEIMHIPQTHFIVSKGGKYPVQIQAPFYFKYKKKIPLYKPEADFNEAKPIACLTASRLMNSAATAKIELSPGQFD